MAPEYTLTLSTSCSYSLNSHACTVFRHIKVVVKATVSQLPGVIYIAMVTHACSPLELLPGDEAKLYAAAVSIYCFLFPSCRCVNVGTITGLWVRIVFCPRVCLHLRPVNGTLLMRHPRSSISNAFHTHPVNVFLWICVIYKPVRL